jgi:uncharacterized BrkB/YihY/UPF0761 family membrane protein
MQSGALNIGAVVILIGLALPLGVLWVIALIDLLQRADYEFPSRPSGRSDRLLWAFVVVLLSGIGSLFYYFMVMRRYPKRRW